LEFSPQHTVKKVSGFIKIGEDCPKALVKIPVWRRGKSWKTHGWEHVSKQVIKDLWKNSLLEKRNIWENSCLRKGTLTVSKGFCENSWLGMGISGKTRGFIRETCSRLERVWSVTSQLGAGKWTGTFSQCTSSSGRNQTECKVNPRVYVTPSKKLDPQISLKGLFETLPIDEK
jgi:hypothetical protein